MKKYTFSVMKISFIFVLSFFDVSYCCLFQGGFTVRTQMLYVTRLLEYYTRIN